MRMSDVQVGMWLRPKIGLGGFLNEECGIFVTEITEHGFKYTTVGVQSLIPRWGMYAPREGHEHYGINGECLYEQAP